MKIRLTEEQQTFLKSGSVVHTSDETYYYMPFWFLHLQDDLFELMNFENLPKNLIEHLTQQRNGTNI